MRFVKYTSEAQPRLIIKKKTMARNSKDDCMLSLHMIVRYDHDRICINSMIESMAEILTERR